MAKPIDGRQAIERVARALQEDLLTVLFVGASAATLYEFGPRTTFLRPTIDVDVATTFENKSQYDQFIDRLRQAKSLKHPELHEEGPFCRYYIDGVMTDVIATKEKVLGFTNVWFEEAFENPLVMNIGNDLLVKIISPIYFVASKFSAFRSKDRIGHDDYLASHDREDVIQVLFGVEQMAKELKYGKKPVHDFVRTELRTCLNAPDFNYAVESHFSGFAPKGVDHEILLHELRSWISEID